MDYSNNKLREYSLKILKSRTRVLLNNGFYGILLLNVKLKINSEVKTICTDGECIYFPPTFLDKTNDEDMDFALMHEILHIALKHVYRGKGKDKKYFNLACDIVVNSNILHDSNFSKKFYDNKIYPQLTPDNDDGYKYTTEELYEMLYKASKPKDKDDDGIKVKIDLKKDEKEEYSESDDSFKKNDDEQKKYESNNNAKSNFNDKEQVNSSNKSNYSEEKQSNGVNEDKKEKNKLDNDSIRDNKEPSCDSNRNSEFGTNQSQNEQSISNGSTDKDNNIDNNESECMDNGFDSHEFWKEELTKDDKNDDLERTNNLLNATEYFLKQDKSSDKAGKIPMCILRLYKEITNSQLDWRKLLNDFIFEEINDYSFMPPDRRFDDSPFYLPDFNEKDFTVKNVLFMIDTSDSMSTEEITYAYSEIVGAINQFDGKLSGWLGFFDANVVDPIPFESVDDVKKIMPCGGGGTSFSKVFEYIKNNFEKLKPSYIIILTDGFDVIPSKEVAMGIPVLWIINNDFVTPEWGKIARIKVNNGEMNDGK